MANHEHSCIDQQETELFNQYAAEYTEKYDYPHCYEITAYDFKKGTQFLEDSLGSVLEMGCGNGNLYPLICPMSTKYFGIDFSENLVTMARNQSVRSGDRFEVNNIKNTGLNSNRFDTIISYGVLHHTVEYVTILKEMCRLLKPGGHMILYEPNRDAIFIEMLRYFRKRLDKKFSSNQESFSKKELESLFTLAGFEPVYYVYSLYALGFFADIKYKFLPKSLTFFFYQIAKQAEKIIERIPGDFIKKQAFAINFIGKKPMTAKDGSISSTN